MFIRRNLIGWLALFTALGGTSYAATQLAPGQSSCDPRGSATIAQDAVGRFYSRTFTDRTAGLPRTRWYVCAFKHGTSRVVYRSTTNGRAGSPVPLGKSARVSGRYAAFLVTGGSNPCGVGFFSVQVDDLVTGHAMFRTRPVHPPAFSDLCEASLVLKANGSVAWIAPGPRPPGRHGTGSGSIWYVKRHDSTGTATVDAGEGIDPHSLAAGGSWLYWTRSVGSPPGPRSAPFH